MPVLRLVNTSAPTPRSMLVPMLINTPVSKQQVRMPVPTLANTRLSKLQSQRPAPVPVHMLLSMPALVSKAKASKPALVSKAQASKPASKLHFHMSVPVQA